jgi:hypothetical protein
MPLTALRRQAVKACRHLLSEENRDPYSPTYGCLDRRFWGWKTVDFPEATLQRNAYSLAWLLEHPDSQFKINADILLDAVQAALRFSASIQHRDGSFDQAFPHEHSFGATAFLLHSLLGAFLVIRKASPEKFLDTIEACLQRAANFLCLHSEHHGRISNHLAGAALSLRAAAEYFNEPRYKDKSNEIIEQMIASQSVEGWFPEYEGCDPGYQTLCLYYLAQLYRLHSDSRLRAGLERAVEFLSWFAHPDGTFGGEYGSRRTAIFYPGGGAILAREMPMAGRLIEFMLDSIMNGRTVSLDDVDTPNIAPLLENYFTVLDVGTIYPKEESTPLPCQSDAASRDFAEAGIYIRGTSRYYSLFGVSNGGVIKVFDRKQKKAICNDGGYVGQTSTGDYITTQLTKLDRPCEPTENKIRMETDFYSLPRSAPTPASFVLLRLLNLTIMRSIHLGNAIKKLLVALLITKKRSKSLKLTRTLEFGPETIRMTDRISGRLRLRWIEHGRPFVAIHMASARYFEGAAGISGWNSQLVDVDTLHRIGEVEEEVALFE